jgi:hypothetical protein
MAAHGICGCGCGKRARRKAATGDFHCAAPRKACSKLKGAAKEAHNATNVVSILFPKRRIIQKQPVRTQASFGDLAKLAAKLHTKVEDGKEREERLRRERDEAVEGRDQARAQQQQLEVKFIKSMAVVKQLRLRICELEDKVDWQASALSSGGHVPSCLKLGAKKLK